MRSIFLYIATFLFMLGLGILMMSRIFDYDMGIVTYVCAGYFIVTSVAMMLLVSCFEYRSKSIPPADEVPLTKDDDEMSDEEEFKIHSGSEEELLETV